MISPRNETFPIDYHKEVLDQVFMAGCDSEQELAFQGTWLFAGSDCANFDLHPERTLFVATDTINDDILIRGMQKWADAGVRIYLVLGSEKVNRMAIEALTGRCLIRTGVEQSGSLFLVDQGCKGEFGCIFTNGLQDSFSVIRLTTEQIDDQYRLFCHLFWERAQAEFIVQGESGRSAAQNPYGTIDRNHEDVIGNKIALNIKPALSCLYAASIHSLWECDPLPEFNLPTSAFVVMPIDTATRSRLHVLTSRTDNIRLLDQPCPLDILVSDTEASWMLPESSPVEGVNWCLKLSKEQQAEGMNVLSLLLEQARWTFHPAISVEDVDRALRFADSLEIERTSLPERAKELPDIFTVSMDDFLSKKAEDLAQDKTMIDCDFMARTIHYTVSIHPPYCPAKATPDPLHDAWEKAQGQWDQGIEALRNMLQKLDDEKETLAARLANSLTRFFLGQNQTRRSMDKEIERLSHWTCSFAHSSVRMDHIEALQSVRSQISQQSVTFKQKVDETKQQQVWEDQRKKIEQGLEKAKENHKDAKKAMALALPDLEKRRDALEPDFLKAWVIWLDSLSEEVLVSQKMDIENLREYDHHAITSWWDKKKKKCPNKKEISRFMEAFIQGRNKVNRDREKFEKRVEKCNLEVENLIQELDSHGARFVFTPTQSNKGLKKQLSLSEKTVPVFSIDWPNEELPTEGSELYCHNTGRWLVIARHDQIEKATKDATRLKAMLCVKKGEVSRG